MDRLTAAIPSVQRVRCAVEVRAVACDGGAYPAYCLVGRGAHAATVISILGTSQRAALAALRARSW